MRHPRRKRKGKHCQTLFVPAPRNAPRQRSCAQPACQQARHAANQRRWVHKSAHRGSCTGPTHVERVRPWRRAPPAYWRRPGARASTALQEDLTPQETQQQWLDEALTPPALQDGFFLQPAVVVGLIAHFTGLPLQEDIALTARRLQQLGRDIFAGATPYSGGMQDAQTPHLLGQASHSAPAVQRGRATPGP